MQNLKELRKAAMLSQHDLAKKIGVNDMTVSRWECGLAKPRGRHLIRIADALGVTMDDLVGSGGEEEAEATS